MAAVKVGSATLKKLKQQVAALQRKERLARKKLSQALRKANKMSRAFQRKLTLKAQEVKTKVAAVEAAVYHKLANSIKKKAKTVKTKKVKRVASLGLKVKVRKQPVKKKLKAKRAAKQ